MPGYGSEELWWQRPRQGQDQAVDLITGQKQMDVDQSRRRGDAELEHKRNLADVYGEAPKNALKYYWQGAEESRRGDEHQQRMEESAQRMDLANSEEGRRGTRFEHENELHPFNVDNAQYQQDEHNALRPGMANRVRLGDENLQLSQDAMRHGMKNQDDMLGIAQRGAEEAYAMNKFNRERSQRQDLEAQYAGRVSALARAGDTKGVQEAQMDPLYAALPESTRAAIAQEALNTTGEQKGAKTAANQQIFRMTPEGQRYDRAQAQLQGAQQVANDLVETADTYVKNTVGPGAVGFEREAAGAAIQNAMQYLSPAEQAELANANDWNKPELLKRFAAAKLQKAAMEMEQAAVNAPPEMAQQHLQQAKILKQRAAGINAGARRTTLIDGQMMPAPGGTQPAGGTPPPPDRLNLLRKGNRG